MLHQYEWRDFVFRDRITPWITLKIWINYFLLEVKGSFLKCKDWARIAASRKCNVIYSPVSSASLAWYLANWHLTFSSPTPALLEIINVIIIREYSMGMVICIPFSLDIQLIFCLSNTMPRFNLNASLWLLCTIRDELLQKVSLILAPEHTERDLRKDY